MGTTGTSQAQPAAIDFVKIKQQVGNMKKEDLHEKLAKFRTRQLTQQKKQAAKGSQALYNKKRNEEFKEMRKAAEALPASDPEKFKNLWEEINALAHSESDKKLEEFLDEQNSTTEDETEEQPA